MTASVIVFPNSEGGSPAPRNRLRCGAQGIAYAPLPLMPRRIRPVPSEPRATVLSAFLRSALQAMIAAPVRFQNRLIALLPHRRAPHSKGHSFSGFHEEDPLRFHGTAPRRISAGKKPQDCGKQAAVLFDLDGFARFLRGRYPRSTVHHVEAATGISAASVENWLHRRSQPSVQHFSILIQTFGPALLAACLTCPPPWVSEAVQTQRRREIDAQVAKLMSERQTVGGAM